MTQIPLLESGSAMFVAEAGSTVARVTLTPRVYGETWEVKQVTIGTTSTTNQSTFYMYRTLESQGTLVDSSQSGENDTDPTDIVLGTLDHLVCVWRGGDLGAVATVTISGTKDTGR